MRGTSDDEAKYKSVLLKNIAADSSDSKSFTLLMGIYTHEGKYQTVLEESLKFNDYASRTSDKTLSLLSGMYAGQSYMLLDKPDSMYYWFSGIIDMAKEAARENPVPIIMRLAQKGILCVTLDSKSSFWSTSCYC